MRFSQLNADAQKKAMEDCKKWLGDNITPTDLEENYPLWFCEDGEYIGEFRVCSICGDDMINGYCLNSGDRYYCSDECLGHDFTKEEWAQECEENDDSYYTEWY